MLLKRAFGLAAWAASIVPGAAAIQLSATPSDSDLVGAANAMKQNLLTFYAPDRPGSIVGEMLRPDIYYWWQAGGMFGQLIHHWTLTGNDSLNDLISAGMLNQIGDDKNFEPRNQSKDEGNDDQVFWAFAAMDAAEYNFPAPDDKYNVSWLGLAQAVFNRQAERWDTQYCGGGLRWQIFSYNKGYDYKNVPANGGFFQLAARLARFTGNQTYSDWAEKVWDWAETTGLLGPQQNGSADATHVFDGFGINNDCKPVNTVQFTYNFGMMLMGSSFMYNLTNGNSTWGKRVEGLVKGLQDKQYLVGSLGPNTNNGRPSFNGSILSETADEFQTPQNADNDDPSFKAYTLRWMAVATQMAPFIEQDIMTVMQASAQGAAAQCVGQAPGANPNTPPGVSIATPGTGNNWCGRRWYQTSWDGYSGMGEQMSAMSVFQNLLIGKAKAPLTAKTGGTSVSQPDAGTAPSVDIDYSDVLTRPITTADKAGAAIMTLLALAMVVSALWFMVIGD